MVLPRDTRNELLPCGTSAPDFYSPLSDGRMIRLSSFIGKQRVLLVFYPGDYTPVCTKQRCALRDSWRSLEHHKTAVLGINPAPVALHRLFAAKNRLPFPIVSDPHGRIAAAYGCRGWLGSNVRTVYLIDGFGNVAWVQTGVPSIDDVVSAIANLRDNLS